MCRDFSLSMALTAQPGSQGSPTLSHPHSVQQNIDQVRAHGHHGHMGGMCASKSQINMMLCMPQTCGFPPCKRLALGILNREGGLWSLVRAAPGK